MQRSRQTPGPKRSSSDSDSRMRARVSRSRRCFLNGVPEAERDQRRLRVHLDQVLVERESIGERAHEVRGARGERAGSLAQALARGDADAARQVDLGRALRVRRDRRLAPARVAAAARRVPVVARVGGFGHERAHLDHGRIDAQLLSRADGHRAAQAGRQASAARRCTAASRRRTRGWCRAASGRRTARRPVRGAMSTTVAVRAVDPKRGERGLLPLAAAEVDAENVVESCAARLGQRAVSRRARQDGLRASTGFARAL